MVPFLLWAIRIEIVYTHTFFNCDITLYGNNEIIWGNFSFWEMQGLKII